MATPAKETYRQTQDAARQKARELKARTEEEAHRWSARAGRTAHSLATALRSAGYTLREDNQKQLASWSEVAASRVDRIGSYLENEEPGTMIHDIEDQAREHPAAFIGGTLAAGLALGRFFRSSAPEGKERERAFPPSESEFRPSLPEHEITEEARFETGRRPEAPRGPSPAHSMSEPDVRREEEL